jgi:hypothetical protein
MAKPTFALQLYVALALVSVLAAAGRAAPAHGDRVIRAAEGLRKDTSPQRFAPSDFAEMTQSPADVMALSKTRGSAALQSLTIGDHWVYDADAVLYDDFDADGYYRLISIRIDADTYFNLSYVYAVIYLSADGEWFEHFYTTEDFAINGATADDEYFVEVELLSGYPPGRYDVLIELYDADLGLYMDEFGPAQSAALELLPLEDAHFDEPEVIVVVEEHGGGGSISLWTILGLLGLVKLRGPSARASRSSAACRTSTDRCGRFSRRPRRRR